MGLHRSRRPSLLLALAVSAALLVGVAPAVGSDPASALRAPSAEAKEACKKLKRKARGLKGDARAKALQKYKKCLENYDAENPPDGGGGDGGTIDGGGSGVVDGGSTSSPDAKAQAQALIENYEFYRPYASQYSSGDDLIRFCSGTWWRRYTHSGQYTASDTFGGGSWTIKSATQGTYQGYTVYEAVVTMAGTYDNQPANGDIIVDVSPQTTQSYINLGNGLQEYQRRSLSGSC